MNLHPNLFACNSNCSIAPALKVSAAARTTLLPFSFNQCVILAIVVVLPVPLTPTNAIIKGPSLFSSNLLESNSDLDNNSTKLAFKAFSIVGAIVALFSTLKPINLFLIISFISSNASIATSDCSKANSISQRTLSRCDSRITAPLSRSSGLNVS